jgi:hypothetical protein
MKYLVVGDMASNYAAHRPVQKLELWLDPDNGKGIGPSLVDMWKQVAQRTRPRPQELKAMMDKVEPHDKFPNLSVSFAAAYASRKEATYLDQPVKVISGDHLVDLKLSEANTHKQREDAAQLLREVREKEAQERAPQHAPESEGPRPTLRLIKH